MWLWNSPTFTGWGSLVVRSLSLIAVTPLLVTSFDETKITVWYLFASLNIFGNVVSQRIGLTYSRMFSFAMGGAKTLEPIKQLQEDSANNQPNWHSFEEAYGTIGFLNLFTALVNTMVASLIGWYVLKDLVADYHDAQSIWFSFLSFQGFIFIRLLFNRYAIALRGMNYIAVVQRWDILTGLLSVLGGFLVLHFGLGMITLVIVMQGVVCLVVIRNAFLLKKLESGVVSRMKSYSWNSKVFSWAWGPTWKGMVGNFGLQGSTMLVTILYTKFASVTDAACFLFSSNIMSSIVQVAQVPFSSLQPKFSRLLASGKNSEFSSLVKQRILISLLLLATGIVIVGLLLPICLDFISSNVSFLDIQLWLLFWSFNNSCPI